MHCHQTRWSYYHLNCHQFWQIPKKITIWGEIKSDKIVTWIFTKYGDHTITLIITNSGRSPRKSPYWVKKKVNKSSHWPSPNTGKFPQKSYYQSKPVISSLNFDRNCKKTTTVVSLYYNFIQPVGRASSLSCSGHRGCKLCSIDDRSKPRMRLFPRAGWNCSTKRQQFWFFCSSGQN